MNVATEGVLIRETDTCEGSLNRIFEESEGSLRETWREDGSGVIGWPAVTSEIKVAQTTALNEK